MWQKLGTFLLNKYFLKSLFSNNFLLARHYFCLQNIKISFEYADFYAKISLILDTSAKNFITQQTLLSINFVRQIWNQFWFQSLHVLELQDQSELLSNTHCPVTTLYWKSKTHSQFLDIWCIFARKTTFHLEDYPKPMSFFVNPV